MFLDRLMPPENPMEGLGMLFWLIAPLAANLLLRSLGKDGWKDFGLRPNIKGGWIWYPAALLIIPLVVLATLGLGKMFGAVSLSGFSRMGFNALTPLMAAAFGGAAVKNIFEEFAWRGYLTPRFEALGVHPFLSSLLTGFIWAGWHIPYYLYYLDRSELRAHTSLSIPIFIILAFLVLPFHALAYGELRLLSKSVWPAWLLHTVANAVTLPLLSAGFVTLGTGFTGTLLSPGTEGIVLSLLMGSVGLGLCFYRRRRDALRTGELQR
jgi:membrane protease YdiL (CAAX protease family)